MAFHKIASPSTWFDYPVTFASGQRPVHKNEDTWFLRACVTFANSFTSFLRPCTLSEVPIVIVGSSPSLYLRDLVTQRVGLVVQGNSWPKCFKRRGTNGEWNSDIPGGGGTDFIIRMVERTR